jgi:alpha-L-rhamnosidase
VTEVVDLRCEYQRDPLGIDVVRPRLSWHCETPIPNWTQAAYEIAVEDARTAAPVWRSGRVESAESVLVTWGGPDLRSRQACVWRVRVWGSAGDESAWSEPARFEAGLVETPDWRARFITPAADDDGAAGTRPSPYLRREFSINREVARARLYVTALGVYEFEINGQRVGDHVLAPGWSSYDHRLRYQTHDVTTLLRTGDNALGAVLADGWARGYVVERRAVWTDRLALLAQLEVSFCDGSTELIVTDGTWTTTDAGPIRAADLYNGETYDARRQLGGWSSAGYDDQGWGPVSVLERDFAVLCAPLGPPVRRVEEVQPIGIWTAPSGETIVDFGQNLVGCVRIGVRGAAGTEITLRHAEILEDGELAVRMLRTARATDTYILRGDPDGEVWEPRFTFHGFRYAGVSGWPGDLEPSHLRAVVLHSDMARTGWFECSDPLVNRLHENIVWGMRGNFLDVPTDCPQRSERLGWTGDIQVFGPTAVLLFDVAGVLANWLADVAVEQTADGVVPPVIPSVEPGMIAPTCGWGDVATMLPLVLFEHFGDPGVLERQYESMRRWVDCEHRLAGSDLVWSGGWQYGDWLDPTASPDDPSAARTDPDLLATAFFAHSATLLARAARVLGRDDDAARYGDLAARAADAFRSEFTAARGRLVNETQTAYAIALAFDLLLDSQRAGAIAGLCRAVRGDDMRLGTGFLGTPWLCPALADNGHEDVAYRLLMQRQCPSWLYAVTCGATTVWERWDAIRPDGSLNPGGMLSFNHYAFGAIGAWLYHRVAGLAPDPDAPGWKRFRVEPLPGGNLTSAAATVLTPYGAAQSSWTLRDDELELTVVVPPNTRARVLVPGEASRREVGSGRHVWTASVPRELLDRWMPSLAAPRYGLKTRLADLIREPSVMDVIVSVGTKIMAIGSREEIGACTIAECIERAGLDDEEATRLLEAVEAL